MKWHAVAACNALGLTEDVQRHFAAQSDGVRQLGARSAASAGQPGSCHALLPAVSCLASLAAQQKAAAAAMRPQLEAELARKQALLMQVVLGVASGGVSRPGSTSGGEEGGRDAEALRAVVLQLQEQLVMCDAMGV